MTLKNFIANLFIYLNVSVSIDNILCFVNISTHLVRFSTPKPGTFISIRVHFQEYQMSNLEFLTVVLQS